MEITIFMWAVYVMVGCCFCYVAIKILQIISPADKKPQQLQAASKESGELIDKAGDAFNRKDYEMAASIAEKALKIYQSFPEFSGSVVAMYSYQSTVYLALGDFQSSLDYAQKSELTISSLWHRAVCNYFLRDIGECIENCITIKHNTSDVPAVLWLRGVCRWESGDRTMALKDFKEVIKIEEKSSEDYSDVICAPYFRGLGLEILGKKKEALSSLKISYREAKKDGMKWLQQKTIESAKQMKTTSKSK